MLEANLVRSEAKLHALTHPDPDDPLTYSRSTTGEIIGVELNDDERVHSKAQGWERWIEIVARRFVRGADAEFGEYAAVDGDVTLDYWEEREGLERWVDDGGEEFVGPGSPRGQTGVQDF